MNFKNSPAVDNTDWLKTAAIILVAVDHFGYFFIDNSDWWSVFGRLAAPSFFFLMGYAHTRTVPFLWIWLAVLLTLLDSWNNGFTWVTPNILLSFALIRIARPHVQNLIRQYSWPAFAIFIFALLVALPIAANVVDYGAEGWLWALFGLCQRMFADSRSANAVTGNSQDSAPPAHAETKNLGLMRLLACFVASVVYVWLEQREFSFSQIHFAVFIAGVSVLSLSLILFRRGISGIQPPESMAKVLRFIGRHTLEIYTVQLAGSEFLIILLPDLAP